MDGNSVRALWRAGFSILAILLLLPSAALAQGPLSERAANNLATTFTGPLARSLALLRFTTLIVLPGEEEVLDVVCGDKDCAIGMRLC